MAGIIIWMCVLLTSRSACVHVVSGSMWYVRGTKMCKAVAR